ncbi:MAG TPA: hypothetical protein VNL35_13060 [Chloroflexota bacterium]|nr:hypothetical protein [Chloroflexota bacterium]
MVGRSCGGFEGELSHGNLVSQMQTIGGQSHAFSATLNPADWPQ